MEGGCGSAGLGALLTWKAGVLLLSLGSVDPTSSSLLLSLNLGRALLSIFTITSGEKRLPSMTQLLE